jgi:hypothetical protein
MFPTINLPRGVRQVALNKFRAQIRDHDGKMRKLDCHTTPAAAHHEFVAESMRLYGNDEARLPDGITRKQQREHKREAVTAELQRILCAIQERA